MATMNDVREVLASNADPAQKLDRLAALVFEPESESEPIPQQPESHPEPEPDAA